MRPPPDPATVAAHVATLAQTFSTTPATVLRWIELFGLSPMPSTFIVASELRRVRRGRRAATLAAADCAIRNCLDPLLEGFLEGLRRPSNLLDYEFERTLDNWPI